MGMPKAEHLVVMTVDKMDASMVVDSVARLAEYLVDQMDTLMVVRLVVYWVV
jgi:hypothetical protein